ncbi:MAG: asparagine synthase (glutamine-hydrolyzing) [Candidatus Omnitrophica bacterium]|nr:asparagine synthase (glutamine-hydrolyzing) [Candidatus Omnitrophota bacterium]
MCGFLGVFNQGPVQQALFAQSLSLLAHRGPDDSRVRLWNDGALGFVRLAIIDLTSGGAQPMTLPDGKIHVVFNGEIYNYRGLRRQLEAEGALFASQTDTEVILHGYQRWGRQKLLQRLEGMFAFAIYDEVKGCVFAARDHFGQKPFFFRIDGGGGILFASEIKAILKYGGRAEPDFHAALNPLFTTGVSPRGKTMFKGVSQLGGGDCLLYDFKRRSVEVTRYFRPHDLVSEALFNELSTASPGQLVSRYEDTFRQVSQEHLISDAPLASMFSAGVDSSLVTAYASRFRPLDLYYYESGVSEHEHFPRYFADKFKLPLRVHKGNDHEYIFDLPRLVYYFETVLKEDALPLAALCRFARADGIKVLLTGDNGEELFGQTHQVSFAIREQLYRSSLLRFIVKALNRIYPHHWLRYPEDDPRGTDYLVLPPGANFNEVPLNCLYHAGERLPDWKSCQEAYAFIKDPHEAVVQAYMLDEMNFRLQRHLLRSDRYGMMESVELRTPLVALALVRLGLNTPLRWRLRRPRFGFGRYEKKAILKQMLSRQGLPGWYVHRTKVATPFDSRAQFIELIKKWELRELSGFLKVDALLLRRAALESYDPELWRIRVSFIMMEILLRLFVRGQTPENISDEFRGILGFNLKKTAKRS